MTTSPGHFERPTRLLAWMYSAVVLGWPATTMTPRRAMWTPTEIMFEARSTSRPLPSWGLAARSLIAAILAVLSRLVSSSAKPIVRFATQRWGPGASR